MSRQQMLTAIIYDKRGRVLSVGKNSYVKTHPMQAKCAKEVGRPASIYLHAEMDAIVRCHDLSKAYRIFVSRVGRNGDYVNAKPCPICQTAIDRTPIKIVDHT